MAQARGVSTMTARQVVDEYFIEHRTKLLDIAAFLDRLDRAGGADDDYRIAAFQEALATLSRPGPARVVKALTVFSDPTAEPLEALDQKSANGAYDRALARGDG